MWPFSELGEIKLIHKGHYRQNTLDWTHPAWNNTVPFKGLVLVTHGGLSRAEGAQGQWPRCWWTYQQEVKKGSSSTWNTQGLRRPDICLRGSDCPVAEVRDQGSGRFESTPPTPASGGLTPLVLISSSAKPQKGLNGAMDTKCGTVVGTLEKLKKTEARIPSDITQRWWAICWQQIW